jgi:hypothetical protein
MINLTETHFTASGAARRHRNPIRNKIQSRQFARDANSVRAAFQRTTGDITDNLAGFARLSVR